MRKACQHHTQSTHTTAAENLAEPRTLPSKPLPLTHTSRPTAVQPTFSARDCGEPAPLPVPPAAALLMPLMLLASSRVKEFTLIFNADRLLAAPLLLPPPLGGKPAKPDDPPLAAAVLSGPGPAVPCMLLVLASCCCGATAGCLCGLLLLALGPGEGMMKGLPCCCCCWSSVPAAPTFLAYCAVSSLCSFLVKPWTGTGDTQHQQCASVFALTRQTHPYELLRA